MVMNGLAVIRGVGLFAFVQRMGVSTTTRKTIPQAILYWSYYTNYVEDDSGDLWFGVNKSPFLLHWNKRTDSFSEINFDTIPGHIGGNSGINRIVRDDQNNLWIGYDGSGVVKYDHIHNSAVNYRYENGLASSIVSQWFLIKKVACGLVHPMD
jgi:ligand-binding sensor domain-containing protein